MEEKAYHLGKKLGAETKELTAEEKQAAEEKLAWSKAQAERPGTVSEHREAVQKG